MRKGHELSAITLLPGGSGAKGILYVEQATKLPGHKAKLLIV
jgi:hypothetical protein